MLEELHLKAKAFNLKAAVALLQCSTMQVATRCNNEVNKIRPVDHPREAASM
jgi:hypothetical protein